MSYSLQSIVAQLGGTLRGEPDVRIDRVATLEAAQLGDIAFLANSKYQSQLATSQASAFILHPNAQHLTERNVIITHDPYLYFARLAQLLAPSLRHPQGIDASAVVESELPVDVAVGAGAYIGQGVTIGSGSVISAGCYIGDGVQLGNDALLHPRVTLYHGCRIGARAIIHSGAVIGADGFGFARDTDKHWCKIPQTGIVVIGDDVEVGANTTIDRGALENTVIESGVKLDNQIQIAHNVKIGADSAIAGCVGIAGSTQIGRRCMLGGQAGVIGHLKICDDVIVSAGTLVTKSISKPGVYTGSLPQQSHPEWVKNFSHLRHLESMADKIRALEQRLLQLESAK